MDGEKQANVEVEEVGSLEPPLTLSAEVTPLTDSVSKPIVMPDAIFREYPQRKFRLLREAKERIRGVLLDKDAWNVLWQIDGKRTVSQIAANLMLPLDEVVYHTESLRFMGIICALDAIYLPEFIQEKTEKREGDKKRRKSDLFEEEDE